MTNPIATYRKSVKASTQYLSEVRDFVAGHAAEVDFSQEEVANIRLAVDEAYTNIIKHAYSNNDQKSVDIEISYDRNVFCISLIDTGNAFDPSNYSKPDVRQQIKQKKRGGVGVYLIKNLMDEVEYHTDDSINTIRMIKNR